MRHQFSFLFFLLSILFLARANAGDTDSAVEPDRGHATAETEGTQSSSLNESSEAASSDMSSEVATDDTGTTNVPRNDATPLFDMTGGPPVDENTRESDTATESTNTRPNATSGGLPQSANKEKSSTTLQQTPIPQSLPPERAKPANRPFRFGLGVTPCGEHGCGAVARFRMKHISFDLAYGVLPILVTSRKEESNSADFDFTLSKIHADAGIALFFGDRDKGFQDGIRTMGIYDSVMGPGGGLGWTRERQCSRFKNKCWKHFVPGVGSGIKIFPGYRSHVRDHFDMDSNAQISALSILQMYLGLTLMWYL